MVDDGNRFLFEAVQEGGSVRLSLARGECNIVALVKELTRVMDMPAEYYIKYLDGDGDWVTMLTDDDLEAAVCTCASDVLALKILDKTKLETSKYISYTSEVLQLEATTTVGSTYETLSFIRMLKQQQRDQACLHLVRDDSLRLRLYTDPSLFVFSSPGRERSSIQGNNTRTTLKGSSYQIDYYKFYCTQKEYVGKLPVVPPEDAYREVLGANLYRALGVKAAKTTLTKVKVNNPIAAEIIHENPALGYAVMSKKVTPFQVLGTSFVEKLMLPTPRTTPITITTTIPSNPPSASLNLRVEGLWTLTAIAKWIGDMDFLGRSGGNAGFKVVWRQVTTPTSGGVTALPFLLEPVASIKKIDAGYVGGDFTGANNAARVRSKHIAFGVDYQHAILFSSLSPEEKKEFMAGITKIVNMSEREIRELVTSACPFTPQTPADLTSVKSLEDQRAITSLINKQKELQLIYKDELSQAINLPISMTEPTLPWETLEEKITADYERYKHEISRCNQCLEDTTEELRKTARRKDMFCRAGLIAHMKEFRGLHPNRFLECGSSDMLFEASLQTFPEHFIVKSLVSFNSKLCRNTECEVLSALPTHPGIVHPIATFVANLPSDWQNLIPPDIIFRDYVQGVPMVHIVFPDEGPSLESVTARMDMNDKVSRCCEWLKQLLVAVSHLQRNFVVHREIISRFILVSTGNLKLTGFDCALNADPAHGSELVCLCGDPSNPFIAPPEVMEGYQKLFTQLPHNSWLPTCKPTPIRFGESDSFAVGIVMWHLFSPLPGSPGFRPPYILPQLPPQFQRPSSQTQSTTTSCHPAYAVGDVLRSLLVADPKARIKTQAAIDILTQALQQNP